MNEPEQKMLELWQVFVDLAQGKHLHIPAKLDLKLDADDLPDGTYYVFYSTFHTFTTEVDMCHICSLDCTVCSCIDFPLIVRAAVRAANIVLPEELPQRITRRHSRLEKAMFVAKLCEGNGENNDYKKFDPPLVVDVRTTKPGDSLFRQLNIVQFDPMPDNINQCLCLTLLQEGRHGEMEFDSFIKSID